MSSIVKSDCGDTRKNLELGQLVREKQMDALFKAGHSCYEISEILEIPESVVRHYKAEKETKEN